MDDEDPCATEYLRDRMPAGVGSVLERPSVLPCVLKAGIVEFGGEVRRGPLKGEWRLGRNSKDGRGDVIDLQGGSVAGGIRKDPHHLPPEVNHRNERRGPEQI